MRSKKIWIFAGLIVALGVYAYVFDYRKSKDDADVKFEQAKLIHSNPDQINEFTVEKADQKIHLKRDTDGWHLLEPFKDLADNEATELFVSTATSENYSDIAAEGKDLKWAMYGLDKPKATITFFSTAGEKTTFEVSEQKNFEQSSYVRRNHEDRILICTGTWYARAAKSAFDFRDKRMLRFQIAKVEALTFTHDGEKLSLVSKDGVWMNSKDSKKLDQNKVREILQTISDVQAQNFTLETTPSAAQQKELGLDQPMATLQLKIGDKDWTAKLSKAKDGFYYAWTSEPVFVLRIQPDSFSKFRNLNATDLIAKPKPENPALKKLPTIPKPLEENK
jgi:uncharacterized protein (DUF2147 family)